MVPNEPDSVPVGREDVGGRRRGEASGKLSVFEPIISPRMLRPYSPYGMIFWVGLVMAIAQMLPYTLTGYSVRMLRGCESIPGFTGQSTTGAD
jgi:hypothetical protein